MLERHGERRRTQPGDMLFREGDERYDFYVVLEGLVAVISGYGGDERLIAVHGPGRFLGELGLLTGQAALFTAVVREPGEVLVVPAERLRELISQDSALGDLILRAYLLRRELLIGLGAGFTIVGSRYSPTPAGCASSAPATGCRTGGSTWRRMRKRRPCCGRWVLLRRRRRS